MGSGAALPPGRGEPAAEHNTDTCEEEEKQGVQEKKRNNAEDFQILRGRRNVGSRQ